MNLEDSAGDLDLLVDVVRGKLPGRKVFLMGASWGGLLGTVYLSERPGRRRSPAGWRWTARTTSGSAVSSRSSG